MANLFARIFSYVVRDRRLIYIRNDGETLWEYRDGVRLVLKVGGLASENVRWADAIESFKKQEKTMCGDVLLITAFISYLGYFTKHYRLQLMAETWKPYLSQLTVGSFYLSDCLLSISMHFHHIFTKKQTKKIR